MMNQKSEEHSCPNEFSEVLGNFLRQEVDHMNSEGIITNYSYVDPNEVCPTENFNNIQHESSLEDSNSEYNIPESIPDSTTQVDFLSNKEYSGPYNFDASLLPNDTSKNLWRYSHVLNKAYMDIKHQFPIDFRVDSRPDNPLFVRITPQYSEQNSVRELVCRCVQHGYHGDPSNNNILEHIRQHVIRSSNVLAQYVGDIKLNKRLSILLPLMEPQIGNESVREFFQFFCKSSCAAPGMNRREIELIFTLENEHGFVCGRKSLKARICACPKRDLEKEEKKANKDKTKSRLSKGKKRKANHSVLASSEISEVQQHELKDYQLSFMIRGKENALKILNYAEDLCMADAYKRRDQPEEATRRNLDIIVEEKRSRCRKNILKESARP